MASMIGLNNSLWGINESKYDEIDELPLMSTIGPVVIIVVGYLLFVLKLGPEFMKKREAFNLKTTLIVYNALQVAVSAYLVQEVIVGIYMFFAAKVFELLDTVFFVLRKKDKQVTFLHLYHHSSMVAVTWALLKYWPSHNILFISFLNSVVHVFMYTYYGLAAWSLDVSKNLKWKKYMTRFQLIQFVAMIIHYVASVMVSDCPPAIGVASFVTCNTFFFLVLFFKFYMQTYKKKSNEINNSVITNGKEKKY